jgi:isopenicillin N synthase-like dioxygenase
MAGERLAARRRPKRRPNLTPSAVPGSVGESPQATLEQHETSLEKVSRRLLEDLAERFELGSPPPAAGSP